MKIGIDGRFLTHPQHGGFKTYTECLSAALGRVDRENEYVLYVDRKPSPAIKPPGPNFVFRGVAGSAPVIGMPLREQALLPARAVLDHLDVFHSPCLSAPLWMPCPTVVTVHDLIWRESHGASGRGSVKQHLLGKYYCQVASRAVRTSAAILTVSEVSKSDLVRVMGVSPERISVTYEAARPTFRPVTGTSHRNAMRQALTLPPQFILALGSADRRKNIEGLVKAYALLPAAIRKQYPLVILWTHGARTEAVTRLAESLGVAKDLRPGPPNPTDEEMAALYGLASLFVFPSLYEGFGLPPLEAMACGAPVVAADNSSIPEVLGDAAQYARADSPDSLAAAIAGVLQNCVRQEELRTRGYLRVQSFSWEHCATKTLAVYRAAATRTLLHEYDPPKAGIEQQPLIR